MPTGDMASLKVRQSRHGADSPVALLSWNGGAIFRTSPHFTVISTQSLLLSVSGLGRGGELAKERHFAVEILHCGLFRRFHLTGLLSFGEVVILGLKSANGRGGENFMHT